MPVQGWAGGVCQTGAERQELVQRQQRSPQERQRLRSPGGRYCRDRRGSGKTASSGQGGWQDTACHHRTWGGTRRKVSGYAKQPTCQAQISSLCANLPAHTLGEQATAFFLPSRMPDFSQMPPSFKIKYVAQPGTGIHTPPNVGQEAPWPLQPCTGTDNSHGDSQEGVCYLPDQTSISLSLHTQWHFVAPTFRKTICSKH